MIRLDQLGFLKNLKARRSKANVRIASENRQIKKVSGRILSGLEGRGISEEKTFDVKLCVEEAVRNAIVHGNRSDKNKAVKVAYAIEGDQITIEVEDEGVGFDHTVLPDPTDTNYIMRNSGRGVYLIKKLMDSVTFNDPGNKIIMIKKIL